METPADEGQASKWRTKKKGIMGNVGRLKNMRRRTAPDVMKAGEGKAGSRRGKSGRQCPKK